MGIGLDYRRYPPYFTHEFHPEEGIEPWLLLEGYTHVLAIRCSFGYL